MPKDKVKIIEDNSYNYVQVDSDGALLVEGLQDWIKQLETISHSWESGCIDPSFIMQDKETGAKFEIKRVR